MAERSIEKGRGMSPIRGYPPLMRKENQTPRLFAVVGFSVVNASAEFIASIQGDISDPSEQCAVFAASEMIAARLHDFGQIVPIRLSDEFQAWRIDLSGDSPLLDRSIGLMLDYKVLEELAAQILTRLSLVVQFVVSSVYPDTDDISLALDELTTLSEHAILLNLSNSVCGYRSEGMEELFPADRNHGSQVKLDLEKLFFNSIITLDFPTACEYFLKIMDLELQAAETAVSLKPRVCNRLVWIIYVLGSPPGNGPQKPITHNVMGSIAALDAITSLEALKTGVQEIFSMLEEDYQPEPAANKLTLITGYIMEHYQDCNLDASQICEVFDIAPPSLSRMFRREMNNTMLDYIHAVRLSHVKELMIQSAMSLQDISTACGYFSSWTMSRAFKKYEGITPGEYRKSCFDT